MKGMALTKEDIGKIVKAMRKEFPTRKEFNQEMNTLRKESVPRWEFHEFVQYVEKTFMTKMDFRAFAEATQRNFDALFRSIETFKQEMLLLRTDHRSYEGRFENLERRVTVIEGKIG